MNRLMGFHVDVEKTSRTPSPLPLARNLPSGENCKAVMESLWPSGRVISREYLGVAMSRTKIKVWVVATRARALGSAVGCSLVGRAHVWSWSCGVRCPQLETDVRSITGFLSLSKLCIQEKGVP